MGTEINTWSQQNINFVLLLCLCCPFSSFSCFFISFFDLPLEAFLYHSISTFAFYRRFHFFRHDNFFKMMNLLLYDLNCKTKKYDWFVGRNLGKFGSRADEVLHTGAEPLRAIGIAYFCLEECEMGFCGYFSFILFSMSSPWHLFNPPYI